MSRTKASFSHLQLSLFEGSLAPKLRFHIVSFTFEGSLARKRRFHDFTVQFYTDVSQDCGVFTTEGRQEDKTSIFSTSML